MFLVLVSDIACWALHSTISSYADDSSSTISKPNINLLKSVTEEECKIIMNYMSTNDLVANSDKTELLVCRPKKGKNNPTPLHINIGGYDVEESTSIKLLGMHISNDLSWAEHVRQLEKHLHHILFTLR